MHNLLVRCGSAFSTRLILGYITQNRSEGDMADTLAPAKPGRSSAGPAHKKAPVSVAAQTAAKTAKWVALASGKGGCGKTTSSLNLATIAAAEGLTVLLLDADEQQTLSTWHRLREKLDGVPTIRLVTAPLSSFAHAVREIEAMADIDLVIVDTPPGLDNQAGVSQVVRRVDFTLIPSSQAKPDMDSAVEFMGALAALGSRGAFLLTKTSQRWGSYRSAKKRLNGAGDLCPVDVRFLRDIEATHEFGVGVNELNGRRGADDMEAVWDFVRKSLGI